MKEDEKLIQKLKELPRQKERRLEESKNQDKKEADIEPATPENQDKEKDLQPGTPQNEEADQGSISSETSYTSDAVSENSSYATEEASEERELTPTVIPEESWKEPNYPPHGGIKTFMSTPNLSQTIKQSEPKPPTGVELFLLLGVLASVLEFFLKTYRKRKKNLLRIA